MAAFGIAAVITLVLRKNLSLCPFVDHCLPLFRRTVSFFLVLIFSSSVVIVLLVIIIITSSEGIPLDIVNIPYRARVSSSDIGADGRDIIDLCGISFGI